MELTDRIKAPTPQWFKKIRKVCGIIIVIGSAIVGTGTSGELDFPEWLISGAKYAVFMATTGIAVATTAKDDTIKTK